jgi:hypothetical protein
MRVSDTRRSWSAFYPRSRGVVNLYKMCADCRSQTNPVFSTLFLVSAALVLFPSRQCWFEFLYRVVGSCWCRPHKEATPESLRTGAAKFRYFSHTRAQKEVTDVKGESRLRRRARVRGNERETHICHNVHGMSDTSGPKLVRFKLSSIERMALLASSRKTPRKEL